VSQESAWVVGRFKAKPSIVRIQIRFYRIANHPTGSGLHSISQDDNVSLRGQKLAVRVCKHGELVVPFDFQNEDAFRIGFGLIGNSDAVFAYATISSLGVIAAVRECL
jgi:hypothetical protein